MDQQKQYYRLILKIIQALRTYKGNNLRLYLWHPHSALGPRNYGVLATNETVGRNLANIVEFAIENDYPGVWDDIIGEVAGEFIPNDKSKSEFTWLEILSNEVLFYPTDEMIDALIEHLDDLAIDLESYPLSLNIQNADQRVRLVDLKMYDIDKVERLIREKLENL